MSTATTNGHAIESRFADLLREKSGFDLADLDRTATFLELGFDSLFLIQLSQTIRKRFAVKVTFRQLIEEIPTTDQLLDYLSEHSSSSHAGEVAKAAPDVPAKESVLQVSVNEDDTAQSTTSSSSGEQSSPEQTNSGAVSIASICEESCSDDLVQECEQESVSQAATQPGVQQRAPEAATQDPTQDAIASSAPVLNPVPQTATAVARGNPSALQQIILQQTQLMSQHLELLSNAKPAAFQSSAQLQFPAQKDVEPLVPAGSTPEAQSLPTRTPAPTAFASSDDRSATSTIAREPKANLQKATAHVKKETQVQRERFGPYKPVRKGKNNSLTEKQQEHLDRFVANFTAKTQGSKLHAEKHRDHFADPRGVAGYRRIWKSMVYQIGVEKSKGSKLWDLDGNEYVDIAMGFGLNLFGQSPDFVTAAIQEQLGKGVEVGPQCVMAGEAARLLCEFSRKDRATFCCTGSEAVMAAIRAARTVTGKSKVVFFNKDYHGNFEEVLLRSQRMGTKQTTSPAAPGIPSSFADSAIVLEYCSPDSLEAIRENADDIAAVLVEPVQSADPFHEPKDFLQQLRKLCTDNDMALIMDEVITGFRAAPGGAQEHFGVWGDLATYGKVLGGGLPIGALAGKARFMDALDGGTWRYDDDSEPGADMTFFAGTFVRHPLAIAAASSVLKEVKRAGPELQARLTAKTTAMVEELNEFFVSHEFPIRVAKFASLFRFMFPADLEYADMLYFHLLSRGIFTRGWGDNCFLSTEHSEEDIRKIINAVKESCIELRNAGFFPGEPMDSITLNSSKVDEAGPSNRLRSEASVAVLRSVSESMLEPGDLISEIQPEGTNTPLFCMPAADGLTLVYHELSDNLGADQPVYGVVSPGVFGEALPGTLEELASRLIQDIKYVQPEGPYQVIGYCSGGTVAFEVAQQLQAAGDDVSLLSCVETYNWIDAPSTNPSLATQAGYGLERALFIIQNFLLLDTQQKLSFLRSKGERFVSRLSVWKAGIVSWLSGQSSQPKSKVNMADLWREHDDLAEKYQPRVYPGKMLDCKPRRDYRCHKSETGLEANSVIALRMNSYPAGVMNAPFVEELASILQREMNAGTSSISGSSREDSHVNDYVQDAVRQAGGFAM